MSSIRRQNLIIAGLVWSISLAVIIPAYIFVIQRQFNELDNIKNTREELKNEVNSAMNITSENSISKIRSQVEELKAAYDGFVVPSKESIQTLASIEIDKISSEIGLEEFHIDPWSSNEVAAFSECKYLFGQPMQVTFKATFNEFAKFLNMLERYKSVIFINTFSIIRSEEKNTRHQVVMNLEVLVQKEYAEK